MQISSCIIFWVADRKPSSVVFVVLQETCRNNLYKLVSDQTQRTWFCSNRKQRTILHTLWYARRINHCSRCYYNTQVWIAREDWLLASGTRLNGLAPTYLAGELHRVARRHLRSASTVELSVPRVRRSTLGGRAFPVGAARIWNGLPSHVTSSSTLLTF